RRKTAGFGEFCKRYCSCRLHPACENNCRFARIGLNLLHALLVPLPDCFLRPGGDAACAASHLSLTGPGGQQRAGTPIPGTPARSAFLIPSTDALPESVQFQLLPELRIF